MPYVVKCFHCAKDFDAETALPCSCVGASRTFRCPHCGQCFCASPKGYREAFWKGAPDVLWQQRLPRRASAPASPDPPSTGGSPGRPLVLVVDDDPDVRAMARAALEASGFGVMAAADGQEGLRLVREHRPDAVLTDALLPKLDGRKLCAQIKAAPDLRRIPVIIMTGVYKSAKYATEAKSQYGADGYIYKPLQPETLQEALGRVLR